MKESLVFQSHYTKSDSILSYMTSMLDFKPQDLIFEPCGGDGAFVDKIMELCPDPNVVIYEINPAAVTILRDKYRNFQNIQVKETDTLLDEDIIIGRCKFDKIIGNPPYGARNDILKKDELNRVYSKLYTKESYTLFLYTCINCLKENGELCFIIPDTFLSLHRHQKIRRFLLSHTSIRELALFPSSFFPGINFGYANLCIITLSKCSDTLKNLKNVMAIRTGFRKVEDLIDKNVGHTRMLSQQEIYVRVDSAFMFKSTDKIAALINDASIPKIGDIADCVTGFYSGNDKKYLHPLNCNIKNAVKYQPIDQLLISSKDLSEEDKVYGIESDRCFVPIVKGGNVKYLKPDIWFMDWSRKAIDEFRSSKKCRFQNSRYYFRNGIGIPMIRSSKMTSALLEGRLFDQSIVGVFPKDDSLVLYLLGFFNSSICTQLMDAINPSANNSANYIKKIPFVIPSEDIRAEIEHLVNEIMVRLKSGNQAIDDIEGRMNILFDRVFLHRQTERKIVASNQKWKQLALFDW